MNQNPTQHRFTDIGQFRNVVRTVRERAAYHQIPVPTLKFNGTVKLHGTNAAVVESSTHMWAQSRENIITPEKDNAGFATFVANNTAVFKMLFAKIRQADPTIKFDEKIAIYGEWCGQGIMKSVAISQLPKMFVVFKIKVITDDEGEGRWFTTDQINTVFELYQMDSGSATLTDVRIFSITAFKMFEVEIDFNAPEQVQNHLGQLTIEVEQECPVGKYFGVSGTGEGIVWTYQSGAPEGFRADDLVFKVKGEKHSESKVTKLAEVDIEKVNSIKELAVKLVTDHRMEKMVEKLKEQDVKISIENTGVFLKAMGTDVLKEEGDAIEASGYTRQEVMPIVNNIVKQWWMKFLNSNM